MKRVDRVTNGFQKVSVFLVFLLIASWVMFEPAPQPAYAGTLYGITYCCPNEFVSIDTITWTLKTIATAGDGSFGFIAGTEAAVDPGSHRFFVQMSYFDQPYPFHVIAIDTRSGEVTQNLPAGRGFLHLGFDPAIGLFGITKCCPNEFVTIDFSTGTLKPLSIIGDGSYGFVVTAAAVDPGMHRFFLQRAYRDGPYVPHIIAIDTRTGALTQSPPLDRSFSHLGFDPAVGLFGITPEEFVIIDPSTWTLKPLSIVGDQFWYVLANTTVDPGTHRFFVQGSLGSEPPSTNHIIAIDTRTGVAAESPPLDRDFIHLGLLPGFDDASSTHWAFDEIDAISTAGITGGCSADPPLFCPEAPITRGQMAVFLAASLGYSSGSCRGRFSDVPVGHPFCGLIERLYIDGMIEGCNTATGRSFCPDEPITRGQMAVFIETAIGNPPVSCAGRFADVPLDHPFCGFIERLAVDGITGGCGGGKFCPDDPVTRAQMAVFLVAAPDPLMP